MIQSQDTEGLSRTNWPCGREGYHPFGREGKKPKCKQQNIVYELRMEMMKRSLRCRDGTYLGETSRDCYKRTRKHAQGARDFKEGNHIINHCAIFLLNLLCFREVVLNSNCYVSKKVHTNFLKGLKI